ncbi:MAG: ankyrin repeat domain-containing protein [Candidatus Xenobiia bacterium LiM19]
MKNRAIMSGNGSVRQGWGRRCFLLIPVIAIVLLISVGIRARAVHAGKQIHYCDISRAIMNGDFNYCRMMIDKKPDLLAPERGALYSASMSGRMRVAGYLISKGVDVNGHYCCGLTALHGTAARGHVEMAGLLLNNGADINAADEYGRTPLHFAVHEDQMEMAKTLISAGADINKADRYHVSPLSLALIDEKKKIAEYLRGCGAVEAMEGAGEILDDALSGNVDRVKLLLSKNPKLVEVRNDSLHTPLYNAAIGGNRELIEILLSYGADINAKTKNCNSVLSAMTPLAWALFVRDNDMAELLIQKGADPNEKSWYGITPLEWAIAGKGVEDQKIVGMLISAGAKINGRESRAMSAAISHNDISMVEYLLDSGADINAMDSTGSKPLEEAVSYGRLDIAKLLISRGADINAGDKCGNTLLHIAVMGKNTELVELLVSKGLDINVKNNDGRTPLDDALKYSRNLLNVLDALGVDVTARTSRGETALFFVDDPKTAEYLIGKGIGVMITDKEGRTALHEVAGDHDVDVVNVLVNHGADINARDNGGLAPLHEAVFTQCDDIVLYLLEKGADTGIRDNEGRTPLHVAAARGESGMVKLLISRGADINAGDGRGLTPLSLAMMGCDSETAEYIRRHGGIEAVKGAGEIFLAVGNGDAERVGEILKNNPPLSSNRNRRGYTPLLLAAESGWKYVVDTLISHGADVNAKMKCSEWDSGYTPLHMAVRWNYRIVAETLIAHGADVNAQDDRGNTPLAIARDCGLQKMADMLKRHGGH